MGEALPPGDGRCRLCPVSRMKKEYLNVFRQTTRVARASGVIQRRVFLRAAALGLAVPAALHLSRLAVAAPAAPPKRLLIFHMPHGVPNIHYNPKVSGGDLTQFALDQSFKSILAPLEPYKKYVNVYQGFKYPPLGGPHFDSVNFLTNSQSIDDTSPRLSICSTSRAVNKVVMVSERVRNQTAGGV